MAGDELKIHSWQGTKKTLQALIHPLVLSQDERRQMIADAAYYRAERRGFAPGGEVEDWLAAEKEVMERLKAMAECTPQTQASAAVSGAAPKTQPSAAAGDAAPKTQSSAAAGGTAPKNQPSAAASGAASKGSAPGAESHATAAKTTRKKPARRRTKE